MPSLCVYTCNLLPPPLPQLLLIADYSQTLKYTRLSPSRAEFMYTCMRVEARYEAKYGGFIYPLETHRVICMCTYVRACTMCVCVFVCVCTLRRTIRIIAKKKRKIVVRIGNEQRPSPKGWNVCLKNIIRHATRSSAKFSRNSFPFYSWQFKECDS